MEHGNIRMPTITLKDQAAQKTNSPAPQVSALRWKGGKSQEESEDSKSHLLFLKLLLRCDQKADCDDQSDEASCQIVYVNPEQYLKVSIFNVQCSLSNTVEKIF